MLLQVAFDKDAQLRITSYSKKFMYRIVRHFETVPPMSSNKPYNRLLAEQKYRVARSTVVGIRGLPTPAFLLTVAV